MLGKKPHLAAFPGLFPKEAGLGGLMALARVADTREAGL
jgi:hypothetical protein